MTERNGREKTVKRRKGNVGRDEFLPESPMMSSLNKWS